MKLKDLKNVGWSKRITHCCKNCKYRKLLWKRYRCTWFPSKPKVLEEDCCSLFILKKEKSNG